MLKDGQQDAQQILRVLLYIHARAKQTVQTLHQACEGVSISVTLYLSHFQTKAAHTIFGGKTRMFVIAANSSHTHTNTHIQVCISVHTYIHMYIHEHIYSRTHKRTHTLMFNLKAIHKYTLLIASTVDRKHEEINGGRWMQSDGKKEYGIVHQCEM